MDYQTITLELRDGVAHLTLNRPDAANGINRELAEELLLAVTSLADDASRARGVAHAGTGRGSAAAAT